MGDGIGAAVVVPSIRVCLLGEGEKKGIEVPGPGRFSADTLGDGSMDSIILNLSKYSEKPKLGLRALGLLGSGVFADLVDGCGGRGDGAELVDGGGGRGVCAELADGRDGCGDCAELVDGCGVGRGPVCLLGAIFRVGKPLICLGSWLADPCLGVLGNGACPPDDAAKDLLCGLSVGCLDGSALTWAAL